MFGVMLSYPLFVDLYVLLRVEARSREIWRPNWRSTWSCTKKASCVLDHILWPNNVSCYILTNACTVRLIWWDLIGYLVCLPYTLQTNELLGSLAIALPGFGLIGYLVCLPYTLQTNELLGSLAIALPGFGINAIYIWFMIMFQYDLLLLVYSYAW
jgi:hypothetical protein